MQKCVIRHIQIAKAQINLVCASAQSDQCHHCLLKESLNTTECIDLCWGFTAQSTQWVMSSAVSLPNHTFTGPDYRMYEWRVKAQTILRACTWWSDSAYSAHVLSHFFAWHGPGDLWTNYENSIEPDQPHSNRQGTFFTQKLLISFLFLNKNICCGCSLEVPRRGTSNEYLQHMFSLRNKKNIMWIPPLICSYAPRRAIKVS